MIWYILIILFLLLFLWILFGPVILFINTERSRYQLMLPGVVQASVVQYNGLPQIKGWIFFIPFRFNPFRARGKGKKKEERKKEHLFIRLQKSGEKMRNTGMLRDALKAFRVKKLHMNIDTDDFILNAWLVPAFSAVNNDRNVRMQVNFEGNRFLDLDLRTRMGSLAWIFLKNR